MNDSDDAWLVEERLTHSIIGAFFQVYNRLGFGFLESVYVQALERELRARGLRVGREVAVRIYYDGVELCQYRIDMVVNEKVVVEANPRTTFTVLRPVRCSTAFGRRTSRWGCSSISARSPSSFGYSRLTTRNNI